MKEALISLAGEAVEDKREAKYKKYSRQPQFPQPGNHMINVSKEDWIDSEFKRWFGKTPAKTKNWDSVWLGIVLGYLLNALIVMIF